MRRRTVLTLLLGTALILLFFSRVIASGLILARGDIYLYFYPYWHAARQALFTEFQLPLWNPALFMGAPFLANSQAGLFYPLNWLIWALFSVPYAVNASIALHIGIAFLGAFLAARRCYGLHGFAALLGALLFALGGYLTAQVEHINQLQGLAWLPWYFAVWGNTFQAAGTYRADDTWRRILGLSLLLFLQITAGHTQTVFIAGVGFLFWLALTVLFGGEERRRFIAVALLAGVPALLLAVVLAAIQLIPTLELTEYSARQGGLPPNEALSFSLHPLLITRALLPAYGQSLFSEYVAFLPLTGLLVALYGVWSSRRDPQRLIPLLGLALLGLFLAFGLFNPLYQLLARVPPFNLFRVPARWLVLYAFGSAMLAGIGLAHLKQVLPSRRFLYAAAGILVLVMAWGYGSVPLTRFVPLGGEVTAEFPSAFTLLGWAIELSLALLLLAGSLPRFSVTALPLRVTALVALALLALFLASRSLPYNRLTTSAAFSERHPVITRLQALEACPPAAACGPPGRLLSMSDIFFDLGDQAEIETIYGDQLDAAALFDYIVATKQKAIAAPNLPLQYDDLASVDGFDGGILPLRSYTLATGLILPPGSVARDGRLREYLETVPEQRWLDLFNIRYLITDKVNDQWEAGVFFDRQHLVSLSGGQHIDVGHIPDYEGTGLWVLSSGTPGSVRVSANGRSWQFMPSQVGERLWEVIFPTPLMPAAIRLEGPTGSKTWKVEGLALVDARDDTFQGLIPGPLRLLYSGDVKLYENLSVLPRAFLVHNWRWAPTAEEAIAVMAEPAFNPVETAIITGMGQVTGGASGDGGDVEITAYTAEAVTLQSQSDQPALLVLTDAWYPGWQATVNGEPAPIEQVNGMFRGLFLPAGRHEVIFRYAPDGFRLGALFSAAGVLVWLALLAFWLVRRTRVTD